MRSTLKLSRTEFGLPSPIGLVRLRFPCTLGFLGGLALRHGTVLDE